MANTRPFANPVDRYKILDPRKVDVLQQIAASTAVAAEDYDAPETAAYANGIAEVLAWLNGEPPSGELASLLELEDEDR